MTVSLVRLILVVFAGLLAQSAAAAIQPTKNCAAGEASCFSIKIGNRARNFRVYSRPRRSEAAPLVVVLHGDGGNGSKMERLTRQGFNRIADREGAIIVYPESLGETWTAADFEFLRALPRTLATKFPVDALRVYVTGLAGGGAMTYRLACDAAQIYAAAAPVAALPSRTLAQRCKPSRPISIAIINGTEDPAAPWSGAKTLSSASTAKRWLRLDQCGALVDGESVDTNTDDQTSVIAHTAKCVNGTEVQLHEVRGGGHTWPGGEADPAESALGRTSREVDANEVIWSFFVQHRLGGESEETKL